MIERFVDYFAASLPYPETYCRDDGYKAVSPIPFYKRGYRDENGIRYYYGNPNSKKALAVLSGETMGYLRAAGHEDAAIIGIFLKRGARCSRIDLAVTEWIEDDLLTLDTVEQWYKQDKIKSSWLTGGCKMIVDVPKDDLNVTQTIYIGSQTERGKKGLFRAYDKGFEMGLDKHLVTRIEVELRGDKAVSTAFRLAETNDIAGNFRSKFDVDTEEFERLMQAPVAELTRRSHLPKRDEIDTHAGRWQWLIKQIAPVIRQSLADDKRLELTDANLTKFLAAAGLLDLLRDTATELANMKYRDTLEFNNMFYDWLKVEKE
jgi:DNA relaxase NicK